jgi:DNA-binding NtrC family response regulator
MTSHRGRLLIAVESDEFFRCVESHLAAAQNLSAHRCLPEQLDTKLLDDDADAVLVVQPLFRDDLPVAVRRWKALRPDLQVLFVFKRLPSTRSLVDLMRSGAFDVLHAEIETVAGPLIEEVLGNLQKRLEEVRAGSSERLLARGALSGIGLIGESVETQNLFVQILHAARLSCPVLISGEPGSGKRLAAHAIHALGRRAGRQIVTVDCLSLSPALLGVALFGQSAFTAAANSTVTATAPGRGPMLDAAERGTLLLNEISEIPYRIQTPLQRLLDACPDVRLISTSSRRMEYLVSTRSFNADLCYRLNTVGIEVPPLRRRPQDIPLLSQYFLSALAREGRSLTLSEEAAGVLLRYHWPGNIRELKAALEFASALSVDETILPEHLPEAIAGARRSSPEEEPFASTELNLARLERQAILRALQVSGFDKARTAQLLGIGKTSIYRKLKEMSGKRPQA